MVDNLVVVDRGLLGFEAHGHLEWPGVPIRQPEKHFKHDPFFLKILCTFLNVREYVLTVILYLWHNSIAPCTGSC